MNDPRTHNDLSAAERTLRASSLSHDVIVLPQEFSDTNVALYDDSILDLVKLLRADGVDAAFAHDAEHRSWIGKKSAEVLIAFVVGIASNAGWAGICALLRSRHSGRRINAKVARIIQSEGTTSWEWIEVSGTGDEVAAVLEQQERKQI